MPLFLSEDGRILSPAARHIWDQLLASTPSVVGHLDSEHSEQVFVRLEGLAERNGKTVYEELVQEHRARLEQEREKGKYALAVRRRAIERIGLPQVRNHRLSVLDQEEARIREELQSHQQVMPEMVPLLLVRIGNGNE